MSCIFFIVAKAKNKENVMKTRQKIAKYALSIWTEISWSKFLRFRFDWSYHIGLARSKYYYFLVIQFYRFGFVFDWNRPLHCPIRLSKFNYNSLFFIKIFYIWVLVISNYNLLITIMTNFKINCITKHDNLLQIWIHIW